jgi:hypothetical protein
MGGGLSRFIRLREASAAALIICLLAVFFLSFLTISAMAGTETGEFCPTCPDWTNLDGWLAKKDAYEQAQQSGQQSGGQTLASKTDEQISIMQRRSAQKGALCRASPALIHQERSGNSGCESAGLPFGRQSETCTGRPQKILDPALAKSAGVCKLNEASPPRLRRFGEVLLCLLGS